MSAPQPVEIWFEFASSYSYLAVMRVESAARAAGVTLHWRPFLLGPVFLSLGWNDSPFNIYPPKGRYMWRDMARLAAKYDIPFHLPSQFPRNGLLAARVARLGQDQPWIADFARAAMRANFGEDRDIGQPEVIVDILSALDLPAAQLIDAALAPANKLALRRQTEQAAERGIFGAPTLLVGDEMFWGNDRLEDALAWACRSE
ncbi:2-hydroxychromene-2-carboxylate isomerase [Denitromonas halophila]|uniref:2-hydroxychromene-2-carboxylate isomerase n=1 Tax=Denitromonas halophila TaxID=1629404 RepID=A0A557R156_9RHOO|nr:2-hydroxychromene-2-carboxylate isomerase [Denitromonas halophila]TVO58882.1 2-hydroxychromene-2-carboxylate isomerase [Denitromonas halophila]